MGKGKARGKRLVKAGGRAKASAALRAGGTKAAHKTWLRVCPNCGYQPKGAQFDGNQPHAFRCPICFYHGPAIQVKGEDYHHAAFENQRIREPDEGRLVWPEIILILILSALATVLLWKAARGVL